METSTPHQTKGLQDTSVLSIQSWVCHGYVGNRCSVFALQLLGIEVDAINTVNFSNHTGYPSWKGQKLDGDQLYELFDGLVVNELAQYSHLLTGYISTPSSLRNVMKIRSKLKEMNPNLIYVCDPVMGDDGKLYVSKELVSIYANEVMIHATFLLPNQTECEFLTEMKITNEEEAFAAVDKLHGLGIPVVIIKSLNFPGSDEIFTLGSSKLDGNTERWKMKVPRIPRYFSGTGDLFSALLLAWHSKGCSVKEACEKTVNSLNAVLQRTESHKSKELKLIQSKADLESPPTLYRAETLKS